MRPGELIVGDRGARAQQPGDLARAWAVLAEVMDPEVPVVSVVDLGIVRDLDWRAGHLHLVVTPTYSGCPATEVIEGDIRQALEHAGFPAPAVERRLTPAWSTDWISTLGRERLLAYGIAPPEGGASLHGHSPVVCCPQCASGDTELLSEFGSTACKALYRCRACLEPFDYFKCL
ncbi:MULTISPECIES: 1,2-phenylacetyl-CoA epoxidase subunit PaaD [Pseudomonas]|uniref:Phenylacetate-CoA oxygenase subunit PaaJ n=2 Tax=Pseudomonas TaxID=286 RepID=A0A9E6PT52_9PSED|nr:MULTISPECIES: 1,2-phenylacetyl-CoA epoxidase subunit PaaD [Pseudomonas]MCO7518147.1 phenylacetate-CoA oxygenase subunit PaaJ [Pseudomonas sp. 1]MCO7541544.1 phenylacetate-CoA oxygenase subunit PaaJ [Pseudomonas sp. VA159-2]QXH33526.1 phenylacetate-CoA oxygenase subunit PaaJ [Pseudomonas muyukensis]QXI36200.1 phenylacetate-CoA oxygenase subunit PaaJ [Pseudomonas xantholysinigenes]TFF41770.1 phenylacetate-CoA oxygenase subunit PaaJ [Pseudomonas sp. RIT623]